MTLTADLRIGCDVGGTFTDLVVMTADGGVSVHKAPTTPSDQGVGGILAALEHAAGSIDGLDVAGLLGRCSAFVHSTTLALNSVLQRTTARTALITTAGHRDILWLREGGKTQPLNVHVEYPPPLVPRRLTFPVDERIGPEGQVLSELDVDAARATLADVAETGVEAVAVCLLWAVANPVHERALGELIEELMPGVPYSLSHEVNPIIREYRRASATAVDASLKPLMQAHLTDVEQALRARGLIGEFLTVTNAGGVIAADDARARPVQIVNSGPSVAPVAGRYIATQDAADLAPELLIVVDGGGTSLDLSVVRDGEIPLSSEYWLGERFVGDMLGVPAVSIHSIGAGGGSIAWLDAAGLLRVGPRSAGAAPGPACYGQGGMEPTVTDAAVVLGMLDPAGFLGGRLQLRPDLARAAIERHVATPLGIDVVDAAAAIVTVADAKIVDLVRERTVREGLDPRDALIVAGGGSSGFSSDRICAELGCRGVLHPQVAPVLSAFGAVTSDLVRDFRSTLFCTTRRYDLAVIDATLAELRAGAETFLAEVTQPGLEGEISWYVGARYAYQIWEVEVAIEEQHARSDAGIEALAERFHTEHQRLFGVSEPDAEIEIVAWRARATAHVPVPDASDGRRLDRVEDASVRTRAVTFPGAGRFDARVVPLAAMTPGTPVDGPAILADEYATIVVYPGSSAQRRPAGGVLMTPLARGAL